MTEVTPELLARIEAAWAEACAAGIAGVRDESFATVIVRLFRAHGIGLVDPGRQRFLVDERVYQGALWRGQRWQRLATAWLSKQRQPAAEVWRELVRGMVPPDLQVTASTHPHLVEAMALIEEDNGGHLIGIVYPGEPIDLERFAIPAPWQALAQPAEDALAALHDAAPDDYEAFVVGDQGEVERIVAAHPGLEIARRLLNDWFDGWQREDAPHD